MFVLGVSLAVIGSRLGCSAAEADFSRGLLLLLRVSPAAIASSLLVVGARGAERGGAHPRPRVASLRSAHRRALRRREHGGRLRRGQVSSRLPPAMLVLAFGAMMLVTAAAMMRGRKGVTANAAAASEPLPLAKIAMQGAFVGAVTGLVGAGGGALHAHAPPRCSSGASR